MHLNCILLVDIWIDDSYLYGARACANSDCKQVWLIGVADTNARFVVLVVRIKH